jgi:hypothetical protein
LLEKDYILKNNITDRFKPVPYLPALDRLLPINLKSRTITKGPDRDLIGSYGSPLTPELKGVMQMVVSYNGNFYNYCSATLSGEANGTSVITTAAHCVNPDYPFSSTI